MFGDTFHNVLYFIMTIYLFYLFYKKRKVYNLLFSIFLITDLIRDIYLSRYLNPSINIAIECIQGIILIAALVLLLQRKADTTNN